MTSAEKIRLLVFFVLLTSLYIAEASLIAAFALKKLKNKKTRLLRSKPALLVHALVVLTVACLLYAYFIEPYRLQVNTVRLETAKLESTTFRIVQISDLHCDRKIRNERKLVRIVNSLDPDIIVFTGDALNTAGALPQLKSTLKNLNASLAKLAVRGNCDLNYFSHLDLFSDTGFQLLENKTVALEKNGQTLHVTGLLCLYTDPFKDLLKNVPPGQFSVLLCHYSDLAESLAGLNVDLYLAGHTHGGQVAVPFYGALITLAKFGKKYESGLYTVGDTTLYVNRGIGMEGGRAPRVRFLARPEIAVFDIRPPVGPGH
jgi:predicted MPP superfamily phosphohydrolase